MSRRYSHRGSYPLPLAALALAALMGAGMVVWVLLVFARNLPLVAVCASVWLAWQVTGRRTVHPAALSQAARADGDELARPTAEHAAPRRRIESMALTVPAVLETRAEPRRAPMGVTRDQLLADPRSGVRPLRGAL